MVSISLFGLGIIGSRIAKHLEHTGNNITVWNRSAKEEFPHAAKTAQEAASTNKILSFYLKDKAACLSVFEEIKPYLSPEHIILNHSTIDIATVRQLAQACEEIGCCYVDAPFTGSKLAAEKGQLVYYVGCSEKCYENIRPILALSSKASSHTGDIGSACILKLITNLLQAAVIQGLCEGLAIANAHDISNEKLISAIKLNLVSSGLIDFKLPLMAEGNFEPHFTLDNMRKDGTYAIEAAAEKQIDLPLTSLIAQRMAQLCDEGYAGEDYTCLARSIQTNNKLSQG